MKDAFEKFIWNISLEEEETYYCIDNPNKTLSTIGSVDNE